jgi:hypothetical protein
MILCQKRQNWKFSLVISGSILAVVGSMVLCFWLSVIMCPLERILLVKVSRSSRL